MAATGGVGPDGVAAPNSSGVKVIIVGLGIAGLATAIECHRKGHTVVGFEKTPEIRQAGDGIGIATNAATVVSKWGDGSVHRALQSTAVAGKEFLIHDDAGKYRTKVLVSGFRKGEGYGTSRAEFARLAYEHAASLGIDLRFGKDVASYWEDDSKAGVVIDDGERVEADCVFACDGVHSTARAFVGNADLETHPTGYALYRGVIPYDSIKDDPHARWIMESTEGVTMAKALLGDGCYCAIGQVPKSYDVVMIISRKDNRQSVQKSNTAARVNDIAKVLENWPVKDKLVPLARKIADDGLHDIQLLTTEQSKTWISNKGKVMLLGDAAHPFLPSSGQGACQALEDAATVAVTLELAKNMKLGVPTALRIAEKIRCKRVLFVDEVALSVQRAWSNPDWDAIEKDYRTVGIPSPKWLLGHRCQNYAYEEFEKVLHAINSGQEYIPHNIPAEGEKAASFDYEGTPEMNGE